MVLCKKNALHFKCNYSHTWTKQKCGNGYIEGLVISLLTCIVKSSTVFNIVSRKLLEALLTNLIYLCRKKHLGIYKNNMITWDLLQEMLICHET